MICLDLFKKFEIKSVLIKQSSFTYMKSLVNITNQNKNNIYKQLSNLKYNEENLLKYNISFENSKGNMRNLLILETNKSLSLCKDENCKQFLLIAHIV